MPFDFSEGGEGGRSCRLWFTDEPEVGLQGFVTQKDRDAFSAGGYGPFMRVITPEGGCDLPQLPIRKAQTREGMNDVFSGSD